MSFGRTLLFSSDGHGGAGRMDLLTAHERRGRFIDVRPLPGAINTDADEFDATFLADGRTVIFSRSPDLATSEVRLFRAARTARGYDTGVALPESINTPDSSTYAPMLDWSEPSRITFTTRRPADSPRLADLYRVTLRPE